jgi:hypothetical protein
LLSQKWFRGKVKPPPPQKKESKSRQLQLVIGFYCWLRVSAFGKAVIRSLKIHAMKDNVNTAH